MSEPEPLAAAKFWSIGYIDEVGTSSQFVGQKVEFRGEKWLVSMACEQVSLGNRVAGVKKHEEPHEAELIATVWGAQRIKVWRSDSSEQVDEFCGPLTKEEALEARYEYVECLDRDPVLRISHRIKGTIEVPFSITMPGESHRAAYSREAGCIAIKLKKIPTQEDRIQ